jgi:hypothetical protein
MKYGMPGCWRGPVAEGEGEIGFAAQKQYLSFYVVRSILRMTAAARGPIC